MRQECSLKKILKDVDKGVYDVYFLFFRLIKHLKKFFCLFMSNNLI